jgi:hypothetical protein
LNREGAKEKEILESLTRFRVGPEQVKLQSGRVVQVAKCLVHFRLWTGKPIRNTYGGKTVLAFGGKPVFAEIAILRSLQKDGWDGVWVDNYRRKFRIDLPERADPVSLPPKAKDISNEIVLVNHSRNGCWDVFAWKGTSILFAEAKRLKKDYIRPTQRQWLESALTIGVPVNSFLVVEWDLE